MSGSQWQTMEEIPFCVLQKNKRVVSFQLKVT